MQYAQQGHSPTADGTQDAELRHQIRRLSNHVSIVIYDGCNECHVVIGTNTGEAKVGLFLFVLLGLSSLSLFQIYLFFPSSFLACGF